MHKIHPFGKSVNISPWYLKICRCLKVDDICIYIHVYTCIYTGDIYSSQYTWHKTIKSQGRLSRWSLPIPQKHRKLSCNHGTWSSQRSHPRSEHTILITLVLGVVGRKPVYIQNIFSALIWNDLSVYDTTTRPLAHASSKQPWASLDVFY